MRKDKERKVISDKRLNVLVLKRSSTALPWVVRNSIEGFNQLGHTTKVLDLDHIDIATIRRELDRFRPDLIFANNHPGLDPQLTDELKIPQASWFEDDPFYWVRKGDISPYRVLFIYDKAYIPKLKDLGFKHVYLLPLCTNPYHFKEGRPSSESYDLSFAGGSYYKSFEIIEGFLKKWADPKIREITYEAIRLQSDNLSLHIYDILEVVQDKHQYSIPFVDEEGRIMFGRILASGATSIYRGKIINSLDGFALNLYGDEGWRKIIKGNNIRFFDSLPYEELPRLFIASKINLNLATTPIKTTLTQRPFDILACGGFVLTDYRQDIGSLLEIDEEIVCFRNEEELKEKIGYFLKSPKERKRISRRGKERVLKEHTYRHRMEKLISIMREIFG